MSTIKMNDVRHQLQVVVEHKNNAGRLRNASNAILEKYNQHTLRIENWPQMVNEVRANRLSAMQRIEPLLQQFTNAATSKGMDVVRCNGIKEAQQCILTYTQGFNTAFVQANDWSYQLQLQSMLQHHGKNISRGGTGQQIVSIMHAQFVAADTASVVSFSTKHSDTQAISRSKKIIFLVPITGLVEQFTHLDTIIQILNVSNGVNNLHPYLRVFEGPSKVLGSVSEMAVMLIDLGHSKLLQEKDGAAIASCIKCGMCEHGCTVAKNIGHKIKYPALFSPIDMLWHFYAARSRAQALALLSATTMSKAINNYCVVGIDLHASLLQARSIAVQAEKTGIDKHWLQILWKKCMLKRDSFKLLPTQSRKAIMKNTCEFFWTGKGFAPAHAETTYYEQRKKIRK